MKLKSKIAEIAGKRGFKNAYALQKVLDISPTMAARLWSGEFKQIGLETLEKLGELLECSPNDLLGYDVAPVKAEKPPEKRPLNGFEIVKALKKESRVKEKDSGKVFNNSILEIVNSSSDNEYVLTTAAAGELLNLSPRSVRENAEKGLLPGKQGKQSHWFFRRSDVAEYKARRDKE
jgi:DNA-binding Xre family transcriptional regulator